MGGNTFGRIFRLTTYGESHGPGLGGVLDGCPAGLPLDESDVQRELDARRPGAGGPGGAAATARREADRVRVLSGIFEGKTTGAPIAFHVDNTDARSSDYDAVRDVLRPGHADISTLGKYGVRDHRGGGRSSGRETLARVAGGSVALKFLATQGITVRAFTLELGGCAAPLTDIAGAAARPYFCPDAETVAVWDALPARSRNAGDSLGGLVRIEAFGMPAGLGEPVFDKLDARLAYALMGVGAVKGVEVGRGFAAARLSGLAHNDAILPVAGGVAQAGVLPGGPGYGFASNNAGGVLGGISSGAPLELTAAVKPIASISAEQQTVNLAGEAVPLSVGGRHDVCAVPRIVPVLRAMVALCLADFVLLQRAARL